MNKNHKPTVLDGMAELAIAVHGNSLATKIAEFTSKNSYATNICEFLAYHQTEYKVTSVNLISSDSNVDYYDVVTFLKFLNDLNAGVFVVGRKGSDSRFEWAFSHKSIGKIGLGDTTTLAMISSDAKHYDGGAAVKKSIQHEFFLRRDYKISVDLPEDFSHADLNRLKSWLETIPFD